jgi:hypothetical protein
LTARAQAALLSVPMRRPDDSISIFFILVARALKAAR